MSKKPDYRLKVKTKDADNKLTTTIGAAWDNVDDSISIQLTPGVCISWKDELLITLFPTPEKYEPRGSRESP